MTPTQIPNTVAGILTAADRCDRCHASATSRVTFAGGGELFFCGHHTRRYGGALRAAGADVMTAA